jgi:hypothetical protein
MQQQQQQKLILHNSPKDQSKSSSNSIKSVKTNQQNLNLRARVSVCVRVREAIDRERERERERPREQECVCEKSRHGANSREGVKRSISGYKCESYLSVKIVIREPIFRESVKQSILGNPAFSIGGNIIHSGRLHLTFFFFWVLLLLEKPHSKIGKKFPKK